MMRNFKNVQKNYTKLSTTLFQRVLHHIVNNQSQWKCRNGSCLKSKNNIVDTRNIAYCCDKQMRGLSMVPNLHDNIAAIGAFME